MRPRARPELFAEGKLLEQLASVPGVGPWTACVWLAVVYLGEHYFVDVLAGVVYALVATGAVTLFVRWRGRPAD